jgi:Domain of unknown function (DUF1918)
MHASEGDTLTVKAGRQGEPDRHGIIIEIHGKDGEPPYLVRWQDEHESLFFPAVGTVVEQHAGNVKPSAP